MRSRLAELSDHVAIHVRSDTGGRRNLERQSIVAFLLRYWYHTFRGIRWSEIVVAITFLSFALFLAWEGFSQAYGEEPLKMDRWCQSIRQQILAWNRNTSLALPSISVLREDPSMLCATVSMECRNDSRLVDRLADPSYLILTRSWYQSDAVADVASWVPFDATVCLRFSVATSMNLTQTFCHRLAVFSETDRRVPSWKTCRYAEKGMYYHESDGAFRCRTFQRLASVLVTFRYASTSSDVHSIGRIDDVKFHARYVVASASQAGHAPPAFPHLAPPVRLSIYHADDPTLTLDDLSRDARGVSISSLSESRRSGLLLLFFAACLMLPVVIVCSLWWLHALEQWKMYVVRCHHSS
jgi:hypothetical protein